MKLGKHQLRLLKMLARPGTALIVPDKVSRSLVRRGLAQPNCGDSEGFVGITSNGLRALADAADAGDVRLEMDREDFNAASRGE